MFTYLDIFTQGEGLWFASPLVYTYLT
jgi:hypothetical protein